MTEPVPQTVEPAPLKPVPEFVAHLEACLEDAKAGRIIAGAQAFIRHDGMADHRASVNFGDVLMLHAINSAISSLGYMFNRQISAPPGAQPSEAPKLLPAPAQDVQEDAKLAA